MTEEGKKLGLVDVIISPVDLLEVSRKWALDIADGRKPWLRTLHRTDKLSSLSEAHHILQTARQQAKQTARNMPQHQACLDCIEEGIIHGAYSGVLKVPVIVELHKPFSRQKHTESINQYLPFVDVFDIPLMSCSGEVLLFTVYSFNFVIRNALSSSERIS